MEVEYCPPALGTTVVPIPITGQGTLEIGDDGLRVVGAKVANGGRGALIMLVLVAMISVAVILRTVLGIESSWSYGGVVGGGAALLTVMLRRPAKVGERVEQTIPWGNIKKVSWDALHESLVVVVKGMKPKGGLYIRQAKDSELEATIRRRCG